MAAMCALRTRSLSSSKGSAERTSTPCCAFRAWLRELCGTGAGSMFGCGRRCFIASVLKTATACCDIVGDAPSPSTAARRSGVQKARPLLLALLLLLLLPKLPLPQELALWVLQGVALWALQGVVHGVAALPCSLSHGLLPGSQTPVLPPADCGSFTSHTQRNGLPACTWRSDGWSIWSRLTTGGSVHSSERETRRSRRA